MELTFQLSDERSRLSMTMRPEEFDGRPGLDEIRFDGINEPVASETAALVGWLLLAPFVSQRLRFSVKVARPLVNRIVTTWGAPIEIGPANDEPARFPPRTGSLIIAPDGDPEWTVETTRADQPVYRLAVAPLNASGTSIAGANISAKSNITLLGQGLVPLNVTHLLALALIHADFLGIASLVVPANAIDAPPPMKRLTDVDPVVAWRELLKAAGFNLRVEG